jgi:hypothetical protein
MLEVVQKGNNLLKKLQSVFSFDESAIQLINKPGKFVAKKEAKYIYFLTPREKG